MHLKLDPLLAISPDWTSLPQILFFHLDSSINVSSARCPAGPPMYSSLNSLQLQHLCFIPEALSSPLVSFPLLPPKMDLCICSPSSADSTNGRSKKIEQKCYIVTNKCYIVRLAMVISVLNKYRYFSYYYSLSNTV